MAKQLDRENAGWASAFSEHLRAVVSLLEGNRIDAGARLEKAERAYAGCEMSLFSAVLRLRRGQLNGGAAGEAWAGEARQLMGEQAIADPEAMARMICPWPTLRELSPTT